jgi:hypothetical protein
LTSEGWKFISFEEERKLKAEEIDQKLKREKLEENQIQSVLDTNSSVRRTNVTSLILASISTIFIVISTINQFTDTTSEELHSISQKLQRSSNILDSMRISVQRNNPYVNQNNRAKNDSINK